MEQAPPHGNVFEAFRRSAETHAGRTAVLYLGTRYTYRRVLRMAEAFGTALRQQGLAPGTRVLLYLPNSVQWVVSWLGVLACDGVPVPITPIYTAHDLRYIANDSGARHLVCADTNYGYVGQVLSETGIEKVVVSRLTDLLPWWKRLFGWAFDRVPTGKIPREPHVVYLRDLLRQGSPDRPLTPSREGGDTAEILYTGGTTKFPKGVPISHGLFLEAALEHISIPAPLVSPTENVIVGSAPLFHILGQTCGLSTLLVGGALIVMPKVNLDAILDAVERFRAKTLIGVPTLYRMLLDHVRLGLYSLESLVYCFNGGDVLPEEIAHRWKARFDRPIYQGYGATETCGGVFMCPTPGPSPVRSMGTKLPSKAVTIVDPETLEPVPTGTPGELLVRSERMVTAYWNKPEETARAFIEKGGRLWYRTADIVAADEAGHHYFIDRTVDTIKHKGYRISSSEIESVLQEHPAVTGACVVGVPDPKVGERIKAVVVLKQDVKGITGYELLRWCRERLAAYKVPQYVEFRDMLPKSKVGKLLRREIRSEEKRRLSGTSDAALEASGPGEPAGGAGTGKEGP